MSYKRKQPYDCEAGPDNTIARLQGALSVAGAGATSPDQGEPQGSSSIQSEEQSPQSEHDDQTEDESDMGHQRRAISGLRPVQAAVAVEPDNSQRQIHSGDKFPKRRKQQPERHVLRPSSLDKLIQGIWEQIHGGIDLIPQNLLLELIQSRAQQTIDTGRASTITPAQTPSSGLSLISPARSTFGDLIDAIDLPNPRIDDDNDDRTMAFRQRTAFCSRVTQASRTCRSLETIVQARWVEHFEAYVDTLAAAGPDTPRSKHNKAALAEACAHFGWSEKELRNKTSIWRGYKEIKDTGGWAALVFAGMGLYRFCKYRIGFDRESMARLRSLRPAMEVAADTLRPHWRALLAAVGEESTATSVVYAGHPHDYVVCLDGSPPLPLRNTYLQWDPGFSFRHVDECVVDARAWDGDDPRWTPPTLDAATEMPLCDTCGNGQSDDPRVNACLCFPTLFGAAQSLPPPVLVFRTTHGCKNNGLLALCPFERGAAVGEFVGLVTKGLSDVDVMEGCSTAGVRYQIWQGRQGNYTRFVNHSCKANAQYQRFTWLGTQRIILVSKGIEAGAEITVDYSDKYWTGLDKVCLCGESCCRYQKAVGT